MKFSTLIDITAVDYPSRTKRFEMVYHFLSMYKNRRIRLKAQVAEDGMVPSIHEIHPGANWFEREVLTCMVFFFWSPRFTPNFN